MGNPGRYLQQQNRWKQWTPGNYAVHIYIYVIYNIKWSWKLGASCVVGLWGYSLIGMGISRINSGYHGHTRNSGDTWHWITHGNRGSPRLMHVGRTPYTQCGYIHNQIQCFAGKVTLSDRWPVDSPLKNTISQVNLFSSSPQKGSIKITCHNQSTTIYPAGTSSFQFLKT